MKKNLTLALALMACAVLPAHARPPIDVPIDPSLAAWFQSLHNPKKNGMSCCAESDGHILRDSSWRQTPNGYQFKATDGGWYDVEPEAVLDNQTNPTGGAVVFYYDEHPERQFCFVRPVES